jgi:hypothetical protein
LFSKNNCIQFMRLEIDRFKNMNNTHSILREKISNGLQLLRKNLLRKCNMKTK